MQALTHVYTRTHARTHTHTRARPTPTHPHTPCEGLCHFPQVILHLLLLGPLLRDALRESVRTTFFSKRVMQTIEAGDCLISEVANCPAGYDDNARGGYRSPEGPLLLLGHKRTEMYCLCPGSSGPLTRRKTFLRYPQHLFRPSHFTFAQTALTQHMFLQSHPAPTHT